MNLRKLLVRTLLGLYPASWRREYGEEMDSMLLAQPLTATVIGDVFLNAMRQNVRRPDPWKIAALFLISWRIFWILLPAVSQLPSAAWALFVQMDSCVFPLVAFSAGCWTVINEGDVVRSAYAGWWSTMAGDLVPKLMVLLLIALVPDKTIPSWVLLATDHFGTHSASFRYDFARIFLPPRILAAWCGALLSYLVRKRLIATMDTRR